VRGRCNEIFEAQTWLKRGGGRRRGRKRRREEGQRRTQTHAERVEVLEPGFPEDILHDVQVSLAQHLRDVNVAILAPVVQTTLLPTPFSILSLLFVFSTTLYGRSE